MKIKKILTTITLIVLALSAGALVYFNTKTDAVLNDDPVPTNTDNDEIKEPVKVNNGKKLSCYDFVDTLLTKDGFKHLEGAKWSRGEKDFFILDLEKQEIQMADPYRLETLPEIWYKTEYEKYINTTYRHAIQSVDAFGYDGTNSYVIFTNETESITQADSAFREFPLWVDYYVSQFENYGCSVQEDFNIEALKTQKSTATAEDVVSVFDVKSTDGVIRYFNDVHVEGDVKDHPRYRELQSFDEFYDLKGESGFEQFFLISIINQNADKTYERGIGQVQASVIEEFVKDVAYQFTPERNDAKGVETLGIYFIDVDNPNGNFKSLYKKPILGSGYSSIIGESISYLREFGIPFQGTVVGAIKDQTTGYAYIPFSVHSLGTALDAYIQMINFINPKVSFSDDFIRNYTRPFAYEWQKQMGLTELFDEKYGFVDQSIKYVN